MFWNSVFGGLALFAHWEVYAMALVFMVISFGPVAVFANFNFTGENFTIKKSFLLQILPQSLAIIVLICTLYPLILRIGAKADWSFLWQMTLSTPRFIILTMITVSVAIVVLGFIPILSRFPSLQTFIPGVFLLLLMLAKHSEASSDVNMNDMRLIPSFMLVVGFLLVSWLITWLSMIILGFSFKALAKKDDYITGIALLPFIRFLGFVPVFMYGSFLAQQLPK